MGSVIRRLSNFLSHLEESMAGHVGVNGVFLKLGMGNTKGIMVDPSEIWRQRQCESLLQVLLKLMLT
jgi:hypothetical protein